MSRFTASILYVTLTMFKYMAVQLAKRETKYCVVISDSSHMHFSTRCTLHVSYSKIHTKSDHAKPVGELSKCHPVSVYILNIRSAAADVCEARTSAARFTLFG